MPAIGFLSSNSLARTAPFVAAFRQGLSEAGYVEGQSSRSNIAGRRDTTIGCPSLAADLVARKVE